MQQSKMIDKNESSQMKNQTQKVEAIYKSLGNTVVNNSAVNSSNDSTFRLDQIK